MILNPPAPDTEAIRFVLVNDLRGALQHSDRVKQRVIDDLTGQRVPLSQAHTILQAIVDYDLLPLLDYPAIIDTLSQELGPGSFYQRLVQTGDSRAVDHLNYWFGYRPEMIQELAYNALIQGKTGDIAQLFQQGYSPILTEALSQLQSLNATTPSIINLYLTYTPVATINLFPKARAYSALAED